METDSSSPKVSVVVPIYNVAPYLRQCLDSVASQTLRDIEVICVDDGSDDGSVEIAEEYAAADGRFRVIRQQHACVGAARNKGLSLARGEYIYFLDSDDWVERDAFERLSALAGREKLNQVLFASEVHFDDMDAAQDAAEIARRARLVRYYEIPVSIANHPMSGIAIASALIAGDMSVVNPGQRLINREFLIESAIRFPTGVIHEDEFFAAALYAVSRKIMAVQEKYHNRRFRAGSIMTSRDNAVEHLRGCMTAAGAIREFAQTHFADGSAEMDFLHGRVRALESAALRYLRQVTLETPTQGNRNGDWEEIAADDRIAQFVDNALASRLAALESEKARIAKLKKRLEARQQPAPAHAGQDAPDRQTFARPDIKPAFAERNIPVVFATDENYLPYVNVAVNSAVAHAASSNLDILILHSGISAESIQAFAARYAGLESVSVRFVDMSDGLTGSRLDEFKQVDRLPVSACYRLLIPDILTAYGKLIYLDVDVAVCRDLGELYSTDLGGCYFAAAKDVVHSTKPEYLAWAASWGFTDWSGYVNTGVLVMNLEQFRRKPVVDRLLPVVLEAAKWLCDQDALNFICKDAIAPLDPRWNVQLGTYCLKEQIALTGDEMWIAHFTGGQKPWRQPARRYAYRWWRHVDASDASRLWARTWGNALVLPATDAPKVSVVMPVFNAQLYLSEALASVLMQKEMPEIEVVCIDDGSTDDSAEILEFWGKRDPRLHVIRQKNQGAGVARNVGLDVAKGEYIFFLDADDRLSSGTALRQAYEQVQTDDLDILLSDGSVMSEYGNVEQTDAFLRREAVPAERVFAPEALGDNLYIMAPMWLSAKMFRRSFLAEYNLRFPALKRFEDFPMAQLALALARRLGMMPRAMPVRRAGVATSPESTRDASPQILAEAERLFMTSLAERGLTDKFARAARVASIRRLACSLRSAMNFSCFSEISRYCADVVPGLGLKGDETNLESFASAFKFVADVVAAAGNPDILADMFAESLAARRVGLALESRRAGGTAERVRIANREARIVELLRQRRVRDTHITELEGRLASWRKNAKGALARVDELLRQRGVRDARVVELEQRVEAWKRNAEKAQARGDELLRQRGARDERIAELEKHIAVWKANVASSQSRVDELLRQRGVRDARIAELEKHVAAWKANVASSQSRVDELLRQRGVRDARIAELEVRVGAWKSNASSAQKRVEELLRQRGVRDARIAALEETLDRIAAASGCPSQ